MITRAALLVLALTATAALAQRPAETPPAPALPQAPATTPDPPRLRLQNDTPNIVNNVFISAASQRDWGRDQLGERESLAAGRSRAFTLPLGECRFDLRIVYVGGLAEERRNLDLCPGPTVTLPMAATRLPR